MILHTLATRLIVFDDGKVTFFEGTYQDFLDRVGWQNEIRQSPAETGNSSNQALNKKALRRKRAELVNEKSRTLGALQKKIDEIENTIMHLEEKTEQDNEDLLEASVSGDGATIRRLSKAVHASKSKIESLFSELETMHAILEIRSREFEEKFSATEQ
jgi:ATP-binding cassette subfamily F protein 3